MQGETTASNVGPTTSSSSPSDRQQQATVLHVHATNSYVFSGTVYGAQIGNNNVMHHGVDSVQPQVYIYIYVCVCVCVSHVGRSQFVVACSITTHVHYVSTQ